MRRLAAYLTALVLCVTPLAAQDAEEDGPSFLEGLIQDSLSAPGQEVRVRGFEGALSSAARLEELTIADDQGVWLTLRNAELDWTRSALLRGRLEVDSLRAETLVVDRLPSTPADAPPDLPPAEAQGFSLPELPVSIRIGALAIQSAEIGASVLGQAAALSLEGSAQLAGGAGEAVLTIERIDDRDGSIAFEGSFDNADRVLALDLAVEEEAGGIVAGLIDLPGAPSVALSLSGDGPLSDFTAELRLATDGEDRLTGRVTLEGDGDALRFAGDVDGDIAPLFAPDYRDFFGPDVALVVRGRRGPDGTVLERLRLSAAEFRLSGSATIAPDGLPRSFDLTGRIESRDGSPVRLPVSRAPVEIAGADLALSFDETAGERWDATITADSLDTSDIDVARVALTGGGTIARQSDANRVTAGLELSVAGIAFSDPAMTEAVGDRLDGRAEIEWQSGAPVELALLQLAGRGLSMTAAGRIDGLDSALRVEGEAVASVARLSAFSSLAGRRLGGSADLSVTGGGAVLGGDFDLSVTGETRDLRLGIAQLDPLLAGEGQLALDTRRDGTGSFIDHLAVSTPRADISGTAGLRGEGGAVDLAARLTDLSDVLDGAAGPADLTLSAADETGGGTWDVTADATGPGGTALSVAGALADPLSAARFDGTIDARVSDLTVYRAASGLPLAGGIEAALEGAVALEPLSVDATLDAVTRNLSTGIAQADTLLAGRGTLALDAEGTPDSLRIRRFAAETPQLSATASGRLEEGRGDLDYDLRLANLGLFAPGFAGPATAEGRIGRLDGGDWQIRTNATGPGDLTLRASGTAAADFGRLALDLSGRAPGEIANAMLAPNAFTGTIAYDLRVEGPPALSSISGRISTSDARFVVAEPPVALTGLNARVTLSGGQAQLSAASNVDGGGRLTVEGPVRLTAPYAGDLSVTANDVVLTDPNLYRTSIGARLRVEGPLAGGAQIAGTVTVGPSEIQIPSSGLSGAAMIPEIEHQGIPRDVQRTRSRAGLIETSDGGGAGGGPAYGLNLTIRAPNQIFVRGRGLDSEFGGEIRVRGTTANVIPSGQFNLIRGRLDILGQRLTLDEAEISLRGSLVPYLRLLARQDSEDATLFIGIEGPADAPEFTFFADPELPEDEVLSRLLFGKGVDSLTPFQAARLAAAVAELAGRGGLGIIARLRENFGLDELDVSQTDSGGTAVSAGRYISDNIYTDVTVGDGTGEVTLNLDITEGITARGSVDSDGGTGLGVFFERDY